MTDIIELLRGIASHVSVVMNDLDALIDVAWDAAEEIERLMEDIEAKDLRIQRLEEQLVQNIDFKEGTT